MAPHAVELTVAYDGSGFSGYQKQPGQRTVDVTLERAIEKIGGVPPTLWGASRTDSGVHALGQRVAFDTDREIPALGWLRGLNTNLPSDLRVLNVLFRAAGFNPRKHASSKHYRYLLEAGETHNPWFHGRVCHVGPVLARPRAGPRKDKLEGWLDLEAMKEAAEHFIGDHDFRAFQAANDFRTQTRRRLTSVRVEARALDCPMMVAIHVEGPAFLKNMVRIIAGTLIQVGRGQRDPESIPLLLTETAERDQAGITAPAEGLTLISMELNRNMDETDPPEALRGESAPT